MKSMKKVIFLVAAVFIVCENGSVYAGDKREIGCSVLSALCANALFVGGAGLAAKGVLPVARLAGDGASSDIVQQSLQQNFPSIFVGSLLVGSSAYFAYARWMSTRRVSRDNQAVVSTLNAFARVAGIASATYFLLDRGDQVTALLNSSMQ